MSREETAVLRTRTARVTKIKAIDDGSAPHGTFEALVSIFGNIDLAGDRVVKGAFAKSLQTWSSSGDPIPVVWSHQWQDPEMHIGGVLEAEERDEGLWVKAQLDVADDPVAAKVWRLLSTRRVREFSFAYDVLDEKRQNGANELLELDVIEVGPTLKGMNPDTLLLEAKSRRDARAARVSQQVKGAVGSHETATSAGSWDGPAAEARLSNDAGEDVFRTVYAWQDPDADADTKAAWKFPHHEVTEDGTVGAANVQACRTGIGVLNGAQGGASIPNDDVQGVYDHLAKHMRDADEEPPELGGADTSAAAGEDDTHTPPQAVQDNAQRALDAIADGQAGEGFTQTGQDRAEQLAAGDPIPLSDVREINAFLSRHEGDDGREEEGTPAWVAWNAWGGTEAQPWAAGIVEQADADSGGEVDTVGGSGSGTSSRSGGRKARVTLDGSVEQLQDRLRAAITDWASAAFPAWGIYLAGLEATWPDTSTLVAYVETWDQPWGGGNYYEATYEVDADGVAALGEPALVELIGIVGPKSATAVAAEKKATVPVNDPLAGPDWVRAQVDLVELDL